MRKPSALDALFPKVRQEVLAATVLNPQRWWYQNDLARHLCVTPSSLQRELSSLVAAGILRSRRDGNRIYYQPDMTCPFLPELQGIFAKTIGLADVLKAALQPFDEGIELAFVYGSIARSEETSMSDVDLMLIGDVRLAELAIALRAIEQRLQRAVNPTLYTRDEFLKKVAEGNNFLRTVLCAEKLFLKGSEDEFTGGAV
jgi:uncharacterized protein